MVLWSTACYFGVGVLCQTRIQNSIGDLVAKFVYTNMSNYIECIVELPGCPSDTDSEVKRMVEGPDMLMLVEQLRTNKEKRKTKALPCLPVARRGPCPFSVLSFSLLPRRTSFIFILLSFPLFCSLICLGLCIPLSVVAKYHVFNQNAVQRFTSYLN